MVSFLLSFDLTFLPNVTCCFYIALATTKERGVGTTVDGVAAVVAATAKAMVTVSKFVFLAAAFKLVAATAWSGCGAKGRGRGHGGRSG
jgi:hypothetical protein